MPPRCPLYCLPPPIPMPMAGHDSTPPPPRRQPNSGSPEVLPSPQCGHSAPDYGVTTGCLLPPVTPGLLPLNTQRCRGRDRGSGRCQLVSGLPESTEAGRTGAQATGTSGHTWHAVLGISEWRLWNPESSGRFSLSGSCRSVGGSDGHSRPMSFSCLGPSDGAGCLLRRLHRTRGPVTLGLPLQHRPYCRLRRDPPRPSHSPPFSQEGAKGRQLAIKTNDQACVSGVIQDPASATPQKAHRPCALPAAPSPPLALDRPRTVRCLSAGIPWILVTPRCPERPHFWEDVRRSPAASFPHLLERA